MNDCQETPLLQSSSRFERKIHTEVLWRQLFDCLLSRMKTLHIAVDAVSTS